LSLAIALFVFRKECTLLLTCDRRSIIAGSNQLFQTEPIEVRCKVLEEITLEGIVTIAVNNFAAECLRIEFKVRLDLFLDVDVLGIKFVLLGLLSVG